VLVRTNATGCLPGCSDLRGINRSSLKKMGHPSREVFACNSVTSVSFTNTGTPI
jgi:hypothetical protein